MTQYITYIKALTLAFGSFFLPIQPLLLLIGIFICFDTILGVWAAHKNGEKITSRKLAGIIPKMVLYQSSVLLGYVLDYYLISEFTLLIISISYLMTKLIAMTLIFIEVLSINENFESITGKNLFKAFRHMLTRTKNIKDDVDKLVDKALPQDDE